MKRDTRSGILLIAGTAAGVAVMAFHPTAHGLVTGPGASWQAGVNVFVHGLAIAAAPVVFLGLLGLTRRLGFSDTAVAALVAWGVGAVAVISAAVASGFVATAVIKHLSDAPGGTSELSHAFLDYTGFLNQAYAKVYVAATSAAILLWSAAILAGRRLSRAAGFAGLIAGAALLLGIFSGRLRLNVHGFGLVILAEAVWLVWVGILLCRDEETPEAAG